MSYAIRSTPCNLAATVRTTILALGTAFALLGTDASAQERTRLSHPLETRLVPSRTLANLEKTFWTCDYAATVMGLLDVDTALLCGEAFNEFKLRKFNGDLDTLLIWWQRNKYREHQAIDRAYRGTARP